jgi:hypothetical protein
MQLGKGNLEKKRPEPAKVESIKGVSDNTDIARVMP